MNNYYVLIYLTEALKNKFKGWSFEFSTSPHKDVWEGYLAKDNTAFRLIFSSHPTETALFYGQYRVPKKSNTTDFFKTLSGKKITGIDLAENDRFITLELNNEYELLFRVFGNKPNIFLIRNNQIIETFKSTGEKPGDAPPKPRSARKRAPDLPENISPKKVIVQANPKFPRHLIPPVIEHYGLKKNETEKIVAVTSKLTEAMLTNPEFRVLTDGNLCLLPENLLPAETQKTFNEINEAIQYVYYQTSKQRRLSAKIQGIKPKIESKINKTESAISQLEQAGKGLERAETYEQYGHILMAHAHTRLSRDAETITMPDLYNGNKPVEIPVDGSLSIAENAQNYYEKSSKAIRNVEESYRRLEEAKKEREKLYGIRSSLETINKVYEFDDWFKEQQDQLAGLGILSQKISTEKKPYRTLQLDGYDIWLGKNARSNDRLTTDAHKEDVWMHARGVAGSHLVIRMNNQKEMPPKPLLLKAASLAAWNSKARGAGLVPVIITKRKYITKPKGAPAGTVRIQREQVEMVEPRDIMKSEK